MMQKINQAGIDLIKRFEGCKLKAYQDTANVWTIGWGSTMYKDGGKPKAGDVITQAQADELLMWEIGLKEQGVRDAIAPYKINDNQFSALVSFAYNLGLGNLRKSTLLKKVRTDPADPSIALEFAKWVNVGGQVLKGLVRRRKAECDLYYFK